MWLNLQVNWCTWKVEQVCSLLKFYFGPGCLEIKILMELWSFELLFCLSSNNSLGFSTFSDLPNAGLTNFLNSLFGLPNVVYLSHFHVTCQVYGLQVIFVFFLWVRCALMDHYLCGFYFHWKWHTFSKLW